MPRRLPSAMPYRACLLCRLRSLYCDRLRNGSANFMQNTLFVLFRSPLPDRKAKGRGTADPAWLVAGWLAWLAGHRSYRRAGTVLYYPRLALLRPRLLMHCHCIAIPFAFACAFAGDIRALDTVTVTLALALALALAMAMAMDAFHYNRLAAALGLLSASCTKLAPVPRQAMVWPRLVFYSFLFSSRPGFLSAFSR